MRAIKVSETKLIPHFVADRPMSLRILSGLDLVKHSVKIGLMTQASTSDSFRQQFSNYPCFDLSYCGVVDGPCPCNGALRLCKKGKALKRSITTISDSGVFTKQGGIIDYQELFKRYDNMKIERGIMLDVLGDKDKTTESAKKAMEIYSTKSWNFKLIGVAQGNNAAEYVECYNHLLNLGFEEIAIGGLLKKRKNTARYVFTNNNNISEVVKSIKSEWPDDRCFVLGVYHPKRHELLDSLGVDAADYKGWIFQYKKQFEDPISHHVDRLLQTRHFIEKNILNRLSGQPVKPIDSINIDSVNKDNLTAKGGRVYPISKNDLARKIDIKSKQIIIISCGKTKAKLDQCIAKDAYIGKSFLLKKKFAEISGNPWFILSAKYGLIRPTQIINPNYNQTINSNKDIENLSKKILSRISDYSEFSDVDKIIFLGPASYAESLKLVFCDTRSPMVVHMTKGMRQGEAQRLIKERISELGNLDIMRS